MKNLDLDVATETRSETFGDCTRSKRVALSNSDRIGKAVAYMNQNLDKPMRVSELAAIANVSMSHFFVLFKQHMNCSPLLYLTRLRIQRACQLLESTEVRVKEVAEALGYEDPFYFSRVFKSVSAMAPMHYRNLGLDLRIEIKESIKPKLRSY
jgi:transcriptional regulator GlxA family with amidase domain